MKTACYLIVFLSVYSSAIAQAQIPTAEAQIKAAVLAAPEDKRDNATVYGYDKDGNFTELRKGNNEMICLADDPAKDGFNASCYHRDLEPFMVRGRELKKKGKSFQEIFDIREKEVKSGKLKMPEDPTTLFVYSAPAEAYNAETGAVEHGSFRYVVYIPYATTESTGLPLKPEAPGMPWIMDPGTHRAHIMINPPAE